MKYFAITIGPIYKTFTNVRHTRELWAASFCFSFITRNLLKELRDNNIITKEDIILPYVEDEKLYERKGIGLFPDRIIIKVKEGTLSSVFEKSIGKVIEKLVKEIVPYIDEKNKNEIREYLKGYFQISYLETDAVEALKKPILELSPFLDSIEQFNKYVQKEELENYLKIFFKNVNRGTEGSESFLERNYEFKDINGNIRIESLIEIATRELKSKEKYKGLINKYLWDKEKKTDRDEEMIEGNKKKKSESTDGLFVEKLIEALKEAYKGENANNNPFRAYHKYVCIIKADGDKVGSYLKGLSTEPEVQQLSTKLMNWATKAYEKIEAYEGLPIFIGGDDLLCIVPVSNGGSNVFTLIQEIDAAFNEEFNGAYVPVSLSYGVSISHYKYPLSETLDIAGELLGKAKEKGGNRIAVQLMKHSGNELMTIFDKSSPVYTQTLKRLRKLLKPGDEEKKNRDLKSVMNNSVLYKIRDNHHLLENILADPKRFVNFINNNFDVKAEYGEDYDEIPTRKTDDGKYLYYDEPLKEQYFYNLKQLMEQVFEEKKERLLRENMNDLVKDTLKDVFSIFRIVKFVKGYEDDKQ